MEFLTIQEAKEKHGKSDSTYRRLIRDIRKEGGERRRHLQPSEGEIKKHRERGESYTYRISDDLIREDLLGEKPQPKQANQSSESPDSELVAALKSHIGSLEKQLLAKDEQINSLTATSGAVAQTFDKIDERSTKMQEQFNRLYGHIQQNVLGKGAEHRKSQTGKPQVNTTNSSTPKKPSLKRFKSSEEKPGLFGRLRKRWGNA